MSEETPEPKVVKDNVTDEKGVTEKPESSKDETDSRVQNLNPVAEAAGSSANGESHISPSSDLIGACGGRDPFPGITLQDGMELCSVVPLSWCPHLTELKPVPREGVNVHSPCLECGNMGENWLCLICFEVHCSRYVNEHMLMHGLATEHKLVLSLVDLSVWCYGCDAYIHNEMLNDIKMIVYRNKFEESTRPK